MAPLFSTTIILKSSKYMSFHRQLLDPKEPGLSFHIPKITILIVTRLKQNLTIFLQFLC